MTQSFTVTVQSPRVASTTVNSLTTGVVINGGPSGMSAYQIAVANGFAGSEAEWLDSLKGAAASLDPATLYGVTLSEGDWDDFPLGWTLGLPEGAADNSPASNTAMVLTQMGVGDLAGIGAQLCYWAAGDNDTLIWAMRLYYGGWGPWNFLDATQFATAAQGAKADTAVQPDSLATVATTGSYNDLEDRPSDGGGSAPSFMFLPTRWQADYGNGLDGRFPAVSMAAGALGGCYCLGVNGPWDHVDIYVPWLEGNATDPGSIDLRVWLATNFADGTRPTNPGRGTAYPTTSGVGFTWHETLVASGVAVTPNALISGAVARYGTTAQDTYTSTIGVQGIIIRPAA